jgi:sterol desaturase/sphingolipid hydroxylase (fatty acid hydroxylase superfamily)
VGTAAAGMAAFAAGQGWGLLNHLPVPLWLSLPVAVMVMDLVIWLQHVMVHAVPTLWRLHRLHHADLDYDLTTGARFHPIEIILSMLIKLATSTVLGPPVVAVILFEVILNGMVMFNRGNVRLPRGLDETLRWLVVTPDMHRVHHFVEDDEANSNFGFNRKARQDADTPREKLGLPVEVRYCDAVATIPPPAMLIDDTLVAPADGVIPVTHGFFAAMHLSRTR